MFSIQFILECIIITTFVVGQHVVHFDIVGTVFQAVEDFHSQVGNVANLILEEFRYVNYYH